MKGSFLWNECCYLGDMENFIARLIFRLLYKSKSVAVNTRQLAGYVEMIRQEVDQHEQKTLVGRKKIPAMPGVIEVMRDWSPYMTIHHVNLVHREIIQMIYDLEAGTPVEIGDLSRFDHFDEQGEDVMPEFYDLANQIIQLPKKVTFTSKASVEHPYFGTLTSKGYYALLAMHLKLHVEQIKKSVQLNRCVGCDCG